MKIEACVAMVTGGASGLGEACVRDIVQRNGKAVILDLQEERGQSLAKELSPNAIFVKVDVTDEDSVRNAIKKSIESFGYINAVINCAGVGIAEKLYSGKKGPIPMANFDRVLKINLYGAVNVMRLAMEQMVSNMPNEENERGVFINTASVAAFDGQTGQIAYSASKAGVVGMTLPVARECAGSGVRIMTIAPGIFDTPMMANAPLKVKEALSNSVPFPKRLGRPNEFSALACHILENSYLNGEVIRLDGAIRMA